MVRVIAGTLMEVGKTKLKPIDIETILNGKKRWEAGPSSGKRSMLKRC